MTVTVNDTVIVLGNRINRLLAAVGLNADAVDLNDAIAYAVRELGYTVTSAAAISDSDLSTIGGDEENQFFDMAEYRALETLQNEYAVKVDMSVGPRRQNYSDIAKMLDSILSRKAAMLASKYGVGLSTISAGVVDLAFAETNE